MKEKRIFTFISTYLLSLILTVSATAKLHYGTIPEPKPASATFIAFFTDDDDILTDTFGGQTWYNSSTGQWYFEDSNFAVDPIPGETGHIWLYGSNGTWYHDSGSADTGDWGTPLSSGSNIQPPTNLTATPGSHGTITLNWTPASGATTYTIYRATLDNGAYETRVAEGITETTYPDTGLSYQEYTYIVVGKDGSSNFSGHSNKASADASLAVELSSFTALADDTKVTLKWGTGSEVGNIGFYVYRSETADGPFKKISELIEGAGNSAIGRTYEYIDKKVEPNKTYFYYLEDIDVQGIRDKSDTIQVTVPLPKKPPEENRLFQNYPNPFNPETWIPFQLAKASEVNIRIYNVTGQLIKTIELGYRQAGIYIEKSKAAHWDGRNDMGEKVASGVYFYELRAEKFRTIRKMFLLK